MEMTKTEVRGKDGLLAAKLSSWQRAYLRSRCISDVLTERPQSPQAILDSRLNYTMMLFLLLFKALNYYFLADVGSRIALLEWCCLGKYTCSQVCRRISLTGPIAPTWQKQEVKTEQHPWTGIAPFTVLLTSTGDMCFH